MTIIHILNSADTTPQMTINKHDPWTYLPEITSEEPAPTQPTADQDYLIVPWENWLATPESFNQQHLGILFPNDGDLTLLAKQLERFTILVLNFPEFTDGRSYSIASTLRQEYHYPNELRAKGDILIDQLHFMWRCGFDSLEVQDAQLAATLVNHPLPFTTFYQSAVQGGEPIYKKR